MILAEFQLQYQKGSKFEPREMNSWQTDYFLIITKND